jgi:pentatricopeptide repeat protein
LLHRRASFLHPNEASMSIREWLKQRITHSAGSGEGTDSFLNRLVFGKETPQQRSLASTTSARIRPSWWTSPPPRRGDDEVMEMDFTTAQARRDAIPELQRLLHKYPHPVLYEALIHAYADSGRWDEARGVAYAARERRLECSRSTYPEIRSEIDRLKEWSPPTWTRCAGSEKEAGRPLPPDDAG